MEGVLDPPKSPSSQPEHKALTPDGPLITMDWKSKGGGWGTPKGEYSQSVFFAKYSWDWRTDIWCEGLGIGVWEKTNVLPCCRNINEAHSLREFFWEQELISFPLGSQKGTPPPHSRKNYGEGRMRGKKAKQKMRPASKLQKSPWV